MDLIRDKIDKLLLELSSDNLIDIAKNLNIDVKEEKNKRTLLRLLQKYIDNIDQEEHLRALINGFKKDYETKGDTVADTSGDQNNTGATLSDQKKPGESNGVANGNNNGLENGNALSGKSLYDLLGARGVDDQISAFHKDFEIKDFIGEVGQRDKLSYIILLKQIKEGIEKGHSDKEIVNAVLRAITPGLYLRNV